MKKKSPFKQKLKTAFWLLVIVGGVWVGLAPHRHPVPHATITVKVEPPLPELPSPEPALPEEKTIPSGGEETQPTPVVVPQGETVTVPVMPEKEQPLAPGVHPKIAIIIDDVGIDLKGSARAIHLPPQVTLSFLPYAVRLKEQAKEAQERGHELILHMPMEPIGHEDPGPGALLVGLPMPELQQRFEAALSSFTGFDGVNNHMGSKFTAYADGMDMVVGELQERHLFFLDSRTSAQSIAKKIAEQKGLPTIGRDVFLDDVQSSDTIRAQLQETERIARRKGYAVAIGHPHEATMDVLGVWVQDVQKRGYELVPLRSLVKNP